MSRIVLFYSLGGHSKKFAEEFAAANGAEVFEVKTVKPLGKFGAYTKGIVTSLKDAPIEIQRLDLPQFDAADIFAPIWADGIASPMIAALELLPKGSKVSLHLVSASGKRGGDRITPLTQKLGLQVDGVEDIKG